jgi:hypothetical protein
MSETLTIMLDNLNNEMQKVVLKFYGYKTMAEGNLDIVPLFVLETEERKGRPDEYLQRMDSV